MRKCEILKVALVAAALLVAGAGCWDPITTEDLPPPKHRPELSINSDAATANSITLRIGNRNEMQIETRCLFKPKTPIPQLWHVLADKPDVSPNDVVQFQVPGLRQNSEYRVKCRFATKTYRLSFTPYSDTFAACTLPKTCVGP